MEKHAVSRMIGAPPGYVGYEEGGQLTEIVRHRPYSLILFDEIEKAHPEVFNILLQVLDNGRLTDGKGRVVNFKNSIIIMTSNVGSHYLKEMASLGFSVGAATSEGEMKERAANFKDKVNEELKNHFKPEFLNRIDEIIIFNPLGKKDIEAIVEKQIAEVKQRIEEKGIKLAIDASVKNYLVEHGYSPEYGARPLRRLIQKVIVDKMADKMIKGELKHGGKIKVSFNKSVREALEPAVTVS